VPEAAVLTASLVRSTPLRRFVSSVDWSRNDVRRCGLRPADVVRIVGVSAGVVLRPAGGRPAERVVVSIQIVFSTASRRVTRDAHRRSSGACLSVNSAAIGIVGRTMPSIFGGGSLSTRLSPHVVESMARSLVLEVEDPSRRDEVVVSGSTAFTASMVHRSRRPSEARTVDVLGRRNARRVLVGDDLSVRPGRAGEHIVFEKVELKMLEQRERLGAPLH